jgi:hypothetical protein
MQVVVVMRNNIEKVLDRGDALGELEDKSEALVAVRAALRACHPHTPFFLRCVYLKLVTACSANDPMAAVPLRRYLSTGVATHPRSHTCIDMSHCFGVGVMLHCKHHSTHSRTRCVRAGLIEVQQESRKTQARHVVAKRPLVDHHLRDCDHHHHDCCHRRGREEQEEGQRQHHRHHYFGAVNVNWMQLCARTRTHVQAPCRE